MRLCMTKVRGCAETLASGLMHNPLQKSGCAREGLSLPVLPEVWHDMTDLSAAWLRGMASGSFPEMLIYQWLKSKTRFVNAFTIPPYPSSMRQKSMPTLFWPRKEVRAGISLAWEDAEKRRCRWLASLASCLGAPAQKAGMGAGARLPQPFACPLVGSSSFSYSCCVGWLSNHPPQKHFMWARSLLIICPLFASSLQLQI